MGNGNHTLKMANTDYFLEIIDDNRKRTRLLHNLYTYLIVPRFSIMSSTSLRVASC